MPNTPDNKGNNFNPTAMILNDLTENELENTVKGLNQYADMAEPINPIGASMLRKAAHEVSTAQQELRSQSTIKAAVEINKNRGNIRDGVPTQIGFDGDTLNEECPKSNYDGHLEFIRRPEIKED